MAARELPFQCITNGAMASTNLIVGEPIYIKDWSQVSLIAVWDGNPTGLFSFKTSNHQQPYLIDGVTPNPAAPAMTLLTLPSGFAAGQPAGGVGNFDFQFLGMPELWLQTFYLNATGAGTLNVFASAKR